MFSSPSLLDEHPGATRAVIMDSTEYSTNGNDYQQQSNATDQSMSQSSDGKSGGKRGEQIYASKDQDDNRKLFVGGLSYHTNEESLAKYFSQYGEVTDCEIKKDPTSGKPRGFGFVLFAKDESVRNVLDVPDHKLDGKSIDPKHAEKLKKPEKKKKIFIGGLGGDVKDEQVQEYFSQFGKVVETEFPEEKNSKRRLGFAFVTFETPEEAQAAQKQRYHQVGSKKVEVSEAVTREERQQQKMRSFGMGMGMRGAPRGRGGYGQGYRGGFGGYGGYEDPGAYGGYNQGSYGGGGYGGYGGHGGNPGYQGGYGGGGYDHSQGGGYQNQGHGGYGGEYGGAGGNYGGGYSGGYGGYSGYSGYGGGYHSGYEQSGHGKAPVNRRGGGAQHHPYSR